MAQCIGLLVLVVTLMLLKDCHCSSAAKLKGQSIPPKDLAATDISPNAASKEDDAQQMHRIPRKVLQPHVAPPSAADAKKNPERLVPSGSSDPKQYQKSIRQACMKEFHLIASPPVESKRQVPAGSDDPHMYERLKDFLACWKAMRPHESRQKFSFPSPNAQAAAAAAESDFSLDSDIEPERSVPTGPDPIHHRSFPQSEPAVAALNP